MAQTKWLLKGSIIIIFNIFKIVKEGEVNGEEEEVLGTYATHHQQGASAKKAAANPIWIHTRVVEGIKNSQNQFCGMMLYWRDYNSRALLLYSVQTTRRNNAKLAVVVIRVRTSSLSPLASCFSAQDCRNTRLLLLLLLLRVIGSVDYLKVLVLLELNMEEESAKVQWRIRGMQRGETKAKEPNLWRSETGLVRWIWGASQPDQLSIR